MSSKIQLEPLFQGGMFVGALRALKMFLHEKGEFDHYLVPFAGNFTVAEALVDAGVPPEKVTCGDITLYSSVLGNFVDPQRTIAELGFQVHSPELEELLSGLTLASEDDELHAAARIMWSIKWVQLHGKTDYVKWRRLEMEKQRQVVFGQYASALARMREKIGGSVYTLTDAHENCDKWEARCVQTGESTLILYNPPGYAGGYTKMFDPKGNFSWTEPSIAEIGPKQVIPYVQKMAGFNSAVLLYVTEGHAIEGPEGGWLALYSEINAKTWKRTFVLSNVDSKVSVLNRRKFRRAPEKVPPVYDDHEITPESKISYVKSDMDTVLYFYDLFARELGMVKAEQYYLFCIDGQVAGAMGFNVRTYMTTCMPRLYETFGLSITSTRYARIGRLLMAGMCCREFVDQFQGESTVADGLMLPDIEDIQTTCLTKYHEAKKNRGILKLVKREPLPNGRFHLVYRTPVHEREFGAVVEEWVKKHAGYARKT